MATTMKPSSSRPRKKGNASATISLASLVCVGLALTGVILWHGETKQQEKKLAHSASINTEASPFNTRLLEEDSQDAPTFDDDQKRSETCKNYLWNFLNGTTDQNDYCQAFYNAYRAADCEDDTHMSILGISSFETQEDDKNTTGKDDDVISTFLFLKAKDEDGHRSNYPFSSSFQLMISLRIGSAVIVSRHSMKKIAIILPTFIALDYLE
jgi:hypothetical protein